MGDYNIRSYSSADSQAVLDIMNYYIENSFAAFPERTLALSFVEELRDIAINDCFYIVETRNGEAIGFALLRKYRPTETFARAVELTFFIMPGHVRKGTGSLLMNTLIEDARNVGADTVLVQISSLNDTSIAFHKKHGFNECGRFLQVGRKKGSDFDVIWMQKFIQPS